MLMTRTQLYLDPESRRLALWKAKLEGTTISEVVRRSIKNYAKPKPKKNPREFLAWLDEFNKKYPTPPSTPTDISEQLDHYLYGTPKKRIRALDI